MKLSIQTIKSVIKEIDVEPESTFDQLREQIRQLYAWPEGSKIILVHKTKILNQTDAKLSSFTPLKDGDRVVVMKKSEPVQAPASVATPAPVAAVAPSPAAPAVLPTPVPTVTAAVTPTTGMQNAGATAAVEAPSALFSTAQIEQLGGMGFPPDAARRALTAAFGNTDRAVEYLIAGNIPNTADAPVVEHGRSQAPLTTTEAAGGAATATGDAPLINNTEGLQTEAFGRAPGAPAAAAAGGAPGMPPNALMSQFGQLAASDPNFLPQVLRVIGEQNPALLGLIEQNPQMFSQVLASLASGDMEDGAELPGPVTIQLTAAEAEAVNRLCELGFSKESALQAYLACDKNEELAANFLFDNVDIDE